MPPAASLGFQDQAVVVTGASSGIGRATATLLAQAGARVGAVARSLDKLEALAETLADQGGDVLPVRCDVTDHEAVHTAAEEIIQAFGQVHGLANVAGYPLVDEAWNAPLHEQDPSLFETVRRVDLDGARAWTQALLEHMMDHGTGAIVYTSSTPALSGYKGTPYTEAKAALLGLMRDVAREYGSHGIRSNAVALGNIATEATLDQTGEAYDQLTEEAALARWGSPQEAAQAIGVLLSPLTSFVSGQVLVVDGGAVFH